MASGIIQVSKSYTDFSSESGNTTTLLIDVELPEGCMVKSAVINISSAFVGTGISVIQLGVGTMIDGYKYGYVDGAVETITPFPSNSTPPMSFIESMTTSTQLGIVIYADADLINLTEGSVNAYITYVNLLSPENADWNVTTGPLHILNKPIIVSKTSTLKTGGGNTTFSIPADTRLLSLTITGTNSDSFDIGTTVSGTELGSGSIANGILDFATSHYFNEGSATTIYITTSTTNNYTIKTQIF